MDAAGSDRAAVFGVSAAGPLAGFFAATHADRTKALVLYNTAARFLPDDGYEIDPEIGKRWERMADSAEVAWGTTEFSALRDLEDPDMRTWVAQYHRMSMGRACAAATFRAMAALDVRAVLPSIHVPTLVISRNESVAHGSPAESRYLVDHIEDARLVELPGRYVAWGLGDTEPVLGEVEEFLTGMRSVPEPHRVLATVLFTDLVSSTERAAQLGDRKWRALLEQLDRMLRREVSRVRGRVVNSAGDGYLATFDGPARAIRCALSIRDAVRNLGIDLRAGLHSGEVELLGEDIGGIAVHIGARVSSMAGPGEVLVSSTVKDLVVGSGIEFQDRGTHTLKGVPDGWRIYSVVG
jgi:class 3 adenylate cyclase